MKRRSKPAGGEEEQACWWRGGACFSRAASDACEGATHLACVACYTRLLYVTMLAVAMLGVCRLLHSTASRVGALGARRLGC